MSCIYNKCFGAEMYLYKIQIEILQSTFDAIENETFISTKNPMHL